MKYIVIILILIITSCKKNTGDISQFKTGTFKTFLEDSDVSSIAVRDDSIQIETYKNRKDTFAIEWKSNFEYVLTKTNPKTVLDSTPFHVKITGFTNNSYTFKASYKGSNFKQKGRAVRQ
ncbi:MAG TPA: DNA topoisomerase IV [Flavobacteriaceae bacterium]|jgi:ATP-dependent Zn protease|nr:DNA topoisomerase IV [Flavobacteriaceae bacterium]HBS11065.1 DNA topoisomerase IV [Flavobacteriaceae bacterium]